MEIQVEICWCRRILELEGSRPTNIEFIRKEEIIKMYM